jgi:rubrerythrin
MEEQLHAFQVLQVAEEIERAGADFYERAAGLFDDAALKAMLQRLADWERGHEETFAEMRREMMRRLGKVSSRDMNPRHLVAQDPRVVAGLVSKAVGGESVDEFAGEKNREDVLNRALERERRTIAFFEGLAERIETADGKAKVRRILKEEHKHVKILEDSLRRC